MIGFGLGLFCMNLCILIPIVSVWKGKNHLKASRSLVWLGMGIANIAGAFFFWLFERKTSRYSSRSLRRSVDAELVFIVLIFIYEVLAFLLAAGGLHGIGVKILLLVILMLMLLQHYRKSINQNWRFLLSLITVLMIIFVNQWSGTNEYKISIIVVTLLVLHEYPLSVVKHFAFVPLVLFVGLSSIAMRVNEGAEYKVIAILAMRNTITYGLIVFMFYIGKKQLMLVEELKRTTLELREKNQRMEEVQLMRERNRIAREIHDTLGHTLTGAIIQLEAAKKMVPVDPEQAIVIIERTQETTREGFADVKRAIHALRPMMIEESNLQDALTGLVDRVQTECGVEVNLEIDEALVLEDGCKIALYRMAQEGITNSLRHGEASIIRIDIRQKQNSIRLVMEDNGLGCGHIVEGYGLKGIRERVTQFDGQMAIKSTPKNGFMMMICIPQEI
ncbi:hypothetical protein SANA_20040 [Gottschalkiaceae bacterium SANA]|nr:hypothetical protein SANA_20040 [Gottschalkiaceae bacterium SANA]